MADCDRKLEECMSGHMSIDRPSGLDKHGCANGAGWVSYGAIKDQGVWGVGHRTACTIMGVDSLGKKNLHSISASL